MMNSAHYPVPVTQNKPASKEQIGVGERTPAVHVTVPEPPVRRYPVPQETCSVAPSAIGKDELAAVT